MSKKPVKKTTAANPVPAMGAVPSPRDYRDVQLAQIAAVGPLPSKHIEDVTSLPVWHQHKIGACVGHAGAKYKQHLDRLETGKVFPLSARFLYTVAKCRDAFKDEGTYPRLVAKIVKDHGVATEKTMPNDTLLDHETYVYNRDESKIPAAAFKEAAPFKISGYAFVNVKSAEEMKRAIVDWHGAMLLMSIGNEWWVPSWNEKDVVPLRDPKSPVGGHEVYLYGYEDVGGRTKFYIFNSWSVDWGAKGMAWFWHDEYVSHLQEAITFVDMPTQITEDLKDLPEEQAFEHTFLKDMKYGQTSTEVKKLQAALKIDGVYDGPITGYYGLLTAAGVLAFWKKYNLTNWLENTTLKGKSVGPKTRKHLNLLFS